MKKGGILKGRFKKLITERDVYQTGNIPFKSEAHESMVGEKEEALAFYAKLI